MKTYVILFCIALVVLKCSATPLNDLDYSEESKESDERETFPCMPYTDPRLTCNTCFCKKDGTVVSCTLMLCPIELDNENGNLNTAIENGVTAEIASKPETRDETKSSTGS